jgi:DNA-directed RNA polymerases I, II, and III subunit RPABC1
MEKTLTELLHDRGCTDVVVANDHKWIANLPEGPPILVFFVRRQKVGIDEIRSFQAVVHQCSALLIICDDDITPAAKVAMSRKMQLFRVQELAFNVTRHVLVPKHELLSVAEATAFLQKYRVTKDDLPKISVTDPVIKYYGWGAGRLVRIKRHFGVQIGDYDYVRVITKNV